MTAPQPQDSAARGLEPTEISAGRLHLRIWQPGDAPAVHAALREEHIARWNPRPPLAGFEEALGWVVHRIEGWTRGDLASFAVVDATAGKLLGSVSLRQIDVDQGDAVVSYWTVTAARGTGVAPQALGAVTRWAFGSLGLVRIELTHAVENVASCRVAEKAGYRPEGTLRESLRLADGRWYDEHLHARLAGDPWPG